MYVIALTAALLASDILFDVENFVAQDGISEVVLKITNNGSEQARSVFISCAFMTEEERAIDIGRALVTNLAPGQTKYEKAAIATTNGVAKASCYVDKVR